MNGTDMIAQMLLAIEQCIALITLLNSNDFTMNAPMVLKLLCILECLFALITLEVTLIRMDFHVSVDHTR